MNEFEGEDRRHNPYSNISHPFYLKPEALLSMIGLLLTSAVVLTLWITSEINTVDDRSLKNEQSILAMQRYQQQQNDNLGDAIDELKDTSKEQYKALNTKLDKLIERELSR